MKKKTVLLLLLFAMLFSLCSCGAPKTLDEACKKADQLVGKWGRKGTNVSGYEGHYSENSNAYIVTTYSLTAADETESAKEFGARRNCEFVYDGLKDIFSDFDVHIAVIMVDENQNAYYATIDGAYVNVGG